MLFPISSLSQRIAPLQQLTRPAPRSRLHLASTMCMAALMLGACANTKTEDALATGSINMDGYRTRHPIVLAESAETIDIPVGAQVGVLTPRMAHTVTVFAAGARASGARNITIMVPSGSGNEAAANRIAQQVAGALVQGGMTRGAIARSTYPVDDPSADAPIRVAYSRIKAMLTHRCGVWPDQAVTNQQNNDDWEFGCSTQANIAAMAANPEDLVTPTGEDPVDGTRQTKVILKYRDGTQTKADTGAKGASIADSVQGGN